MIVVKIRAAPSPFLVSLLGEDGGCGGRVGQAAEEEDTLQHIVQGESRGTRGSEGNVQSKARSPASPPQDCRPLTDHFLVLESLRT